MTLAGTVWFWLLSYAKGVTQTERQADTPRSSLARNQTLFNDFESFYRPGGAPLAHYA